MLDEPTLLRLADLNLAEAQREHARFLPPYVIEERDGLLLSACGARIPAAPFNAVSRVSALPDKTEEPEVLEAKATQFFLERGTGFGIQLRAHLDERLQQRCEARGLKRKSNAPGMALTAPVAGPVVADETTLMTVRTQADAEAFTCVVSSAFEAIGLPAPIARKLLSQPERWLEPHWHVSLLWEDARPAAGAMLLFSHGIAGIYWVGTLAEARGRGYGEAVTRAVCEHAFARGARAVVLQASQFGEPVYKRIGFREITRYPWYAVPRPS